MPEAAKVASQMSIFSLTAFLI